MKNTKKRTREIIEYANSLTPEEREVFNYYLDQGVGFEIAKERSSFQDYDKVETSPLKFELVFNVDHAHFPIKNIDYFNLQIA